MAKAAAATGTPARATLPLKPNSPDRPVTQRFQAARLQGVYQGGRLVGVLEELDDGGAGHFFLF